MFDKTNESGMGNTIDFNKSDSIVNLSCEVYRLLMNTQTIDALSDSLYEILISKQYIQSANVIFPIKKETGRVPKQSSTKNTSNSLLQLRYNLVFTEPYIGCLDIVADSAEVNVEDLDNFLRAFVKDIEISVSEKLNAINDPKETVTEEQRFLYKSVIDNVHDTIMIIQNNSFVFLNKSAVDLGGYPIDELLNKRFTDFIYYEDVPMIVKNHEKRMAGEYIPPYDFRFVRKNGEIRWGLISATIIEWNNDIASICFITDITDRKKYEHELIDSEAKYRSFINHAIEAIFVLCDDRCVYSNPSATVLTGYNEAEINDIRFSDIFHEDDRELMKSDLLMRLEGYPIPSADRRIIKKNGNHKWGIVNLTKISWKSEPAILCFITDITQRKKIEHEMFENEKRYRDYIENSPEGFIAFDEKGRIDEANRSAEYLLSYGREELKKMTVRDIVAKEHIEKLHLLIVQIKSSGFLSDEIELVRRNGLRVWVNFSGVQINENRYISFFSNVSEQKHSQMILKQTQHYLNSLVNSMPSAIIGLDTDLKITRLNYLAKSYCTSSLGHLLLMNVFTAFSFLKPYENEIKRCVLNKEKLSLNEVFFRHDNDEKFVNILLYPIPHEYRDSVVIRIDDITDRVFFERKLIQSSKMSTMGELAAGMAHEINNPLGSIMSGVQNTLRRISTELPKNLEVAEQLGINLDSLSRYFEERHIYSYLAGISDSASKASKIVANLMSFSRKSNSDFEEVSINKIIESALKIVKNDFDIEKSYDFRHIKITKIFDQSILKVYVDFSEIEQVFFNILKNAAQSIHLAEKKISDPEIIIKTYESKDHAICEITDNGPGIDIENHSKMFEPFFTTKDIGVGTGLGLSVSYFIITKTHNGIISAESADTGGLKLVVKLPIKK